MRHMMTLFKVTYLAVFQCIKFILCIKQVSLLVSEFILERFNLIILPLQHFSLAFLLQHSFWILRSTEMRGRSKVYILILQVKCLQ